MCLGSLRTGNDTMTHLNVASMWIIYERTFLNANTLSSRVLKQLDICVIFQSCAKKPVT